MSTIEAEFEMDLARSIGAAVTMRAFHSLWQTVDQSPLTQERKGFYQEQIAARVAALREARPSELNRQPIPCAA